MSHTQAKNLCLRLLSSCVVGEELSLCVVGGDMGEFSSKCVRGCVDCDCCIGEVGLNVIV